MRFSLSIVAQEQLIHLIQHLLPSDNKLPTTLNKLNNAASFNNNEIHQKNYCISCNYKLCEENKCHDNQCNNFGIITNNFNTFHFINISRNIKNNIQNNFEIIMKYNNNPRPFFDLIDGSYYNKIKKVLFDFISKN